MTIIKDPNEAMTPPPKPASERVKWILHDILQKELTLSLARKLLVLIDDVKGEFEVTFEGTNVVITGSTEVLNSVRVEILKLPQVVRINNYKFRLGNPNEPHLKILC